MINRGLFAALAAGTALAVWVAPAYAQQADVRDYEIQAGDLKLALDDYARQSGQQVIYRVEDVSQARSLGVRGKMTARAALDAVLRGSGFSARYDVSGAVAIVRDGKKADSADGSVEAASAAPTADKVELEEIVVIGTRTELKGFISALPTATISRQDIQTFGYASADQALANIPQISRITLDDVSGGNAGLNSRGGSSRLELRGLPTLTLLNGRRVASSGFVSASGFSEDFVDMGSIPFAAIERVEVLKGGGAALYGTDAVGGVVNFQLRKDFKGVEVGLDSSITDEGDGEVVSPWVVAGWTNDRVSLMGVFNYQKKGAIFARDRDFSANADQREQGGRDNRNPGGANQFLTVDLQSGLPTTLGVRGDCPGDVVTLPDYNLGGGFTVPQNACFSNQNDYSNLVPETELYSGLVTASVNVGPVEFFAEANYVNSKSTSYYAPTYGNIEAGSINTQFSSDFTEAYILFAPFSITDEPNRMDSKKESFRVLAGMRGDAGDFSLETSWSYSESRLSYGFNNALLRDPLIDAINAGTIDIVNPSNNTSSDFDPYRTEQNYLGVSSMTNADFLVRGPLFDVMGNTVSGAFGFEMRGEKIRSQTSEAWANNEIFGLFSGYRGVEGDRTNLAAYGEIVSPLGSIADVQIAARYDRYEDFGGSFNPQFGLTVKPAQFMTLRGAFGTGFRAPSLSQIKLEGEGSDLATDPIRCPVTETPQDCTGPFNTVIDSSGLKAEKTRQFNLGVDFKPSSKIKLSFDYWNVLWKDRITFISALTAINNFPDRVTRGPVDPATPDLPGPITEVRTGFVNQSRVKVDGIDAVLTAGETVGAGQLSLMTQASYMLNYKDYSRTFYPYVDITGEYEQAGPRFRANANLAYAIGAWTVTTQFNYTGSYYVDPNTTISRESSVTFRSLGDKISSWTTIDLGGRYKTENGLAINAGMRNIFDRDPPFDPNGSRNGYDYERSNARGREVFLSLGYSFF